MNNSLFGSVVWHFNQQYDMDSGWGDVKEGRRLMGNTNEYGSDPWATLRVVYKAMGLSKEEIAKHILCKTTRVIDGTMDLAACDKKGE